MVFLSVRFFFEADDVENRGNDEDENIEEKRAWIFAENQEKEKEKRWIHGSTDRIVIVPNLRVKVKVSRPRPNHEMGGFNQTYQQPQQQQQQKKKHNTKVDLELITES